MVVKPSAKRALSLLLAAEGGWISGNRIAEVAGYRFGGRLYELRHLYGYNVERRSAPNGNAVDEYRIPAEPEQQTLRLDVAS